MNSIGFLCKKEKRGKTLFGGEKTSLFYPIRLNSLLAPSMANFINERKVRTPANWVERKE